jgi:hypothetical protein
VEAVGRRTRGGRGRVGTGWHTGCREGEGGREGGYTEGSRPFQAFLSPSRGFEGLGCVVAVAGSAWSAVDDGERDARKRRRKTRPTWRWRRRCLRSHCGVRTRGHA